MKNIFIGVVFLLAAHKVVAQAFPIQFIGHWKGTLTWSRAGQKSQNFAMQLIIKPTDSAHKYTWQIIYGNNNTTDNRPYIIQPVDTAKGHWVVDERNGIFLDTYLLGNCFTGAFTVQGNTIIDKYCVSGNTMQVEFTSIRLTDKKQTGLGTDESPNVDNYRVGSLQVGTLKKIK
jgi:hypothetical protein